MGTNKLLENLPLPDTIWGSWHWPCPEPGLECEQSCVWSPSWTFWSVEQQLQPEVLLHPPPVPHWEEVQEQGVKSGLALQLSTSQTRALAFLLGWTGSFLSCSFLAMKETLLTNELIWPKLYLYPKDLEFKRGLMFLNHYFLCMIFISKQ